MTHSLKGNQRPERNPLEFVFCITMMVSLLPVVLGLVPLPGSLALVPTLFGRGSALVIVLGSAGVVVGIAWRDRDIGLLIQQAALWFLGVGLMFYGVAVWDASGWQAGRVPITLSFGVALGAAARIIQFQIYVHHRARSTDA